MPLGGGQIDQPALAQHIYAPPVPQGELFDILADLAPGRRHLAQRFEVDLDIEVAGVADDGAALDVLEVLARDHALIAGEGHKQVADRGRFEHRHDAEAVHHRLDGLGRIDLRHDDVGA